MPPLVVTLAVDETARAAWNALRRRWFPPERLVVDAHLTLFHALPGEHLAAVLADGAEVAGDVEPFELTVTGARSLGRGVALDVTAEPLLRLHAGLRARWKDWLTRQDAQRFAPHVTVQNKVRPDVAAATLEAVRRDPGPRTATATGLDVWRYLGGPWEHVASVPLAGRR
ncbi:2'-5' RNA ligase family protein [Amycolatopsis sp. FBCC-B4732]|uniref:2'-5' RNA ligase family protein n=1 Tax=Amycolatopsis sp. FBCC-B4732 TaxID=3079339 RepID=UPI001FF2EE37|nr:2'-5' RNA ligase family protein [Amycolatopsis sp. FBCC-B4732]UOX91127.1 2'-5' RNA ligase family protein [Amycolatopsis sp. FBCC-B4732]